MKSFSVFFVNILVIISSISSPILLGGIYSQNSFKNNNDLEKSSLSHNIKPIKINSVINKRFSPELSLFSNLKINLFIDSNSQPITSSTQDLKPIDKEQYMFFFFFLTLLSVVGFFIYVVLKSIFGFSFKEKAKPVATEPTSEFFYCTSCGSKVESGLNFCYQCGTKMA